VVEIDKDEPDDGEHYRDFLETLSFLYGRTNGPDVAKALEREMREFRGFLHALPSARKEAIGARPRCAGDHRILEVRALPPQLHARLCAQVASERSARQACAQSVDL
jgi:hypothetical protein